VLRSLMRSSFAMSENLACSAGWCGTEPEPPTPRVPAKDSCSALQFVEIPRSSKNLWKQSTGYWKSDTRLGGVFGERS